MAESQGREPARKQRRPLLGGLAAPGRKRLARRDQGRLGASDGLARTIERAFSVLTDRELLAQFLAPPEQLRHLAPVLASEPRDPLAPGLDGLERLRVGLQRAGVVREQTRRLAGGDARLLQRRKAIREPGVQRRRLLDSLCGRPNRVERRALALGELRERLSYQIAQPVGVGEATGL